MRWTNGNLEIRSTAFPRKGITVQGHSHNFDHTSIVFTGAVHVKVTAPDGTVVTEQDFIAPSQFLVKAEYFHEITSLEEGTEFWCVYPHRNEQGEVVPVNVGFERGYQ